MELILQGLLWFLAIVLIAIGVSGLVYLIFELTKEYPDE